MADQYVTDLPWLPLSMKLFFPPVAAVYFCLDEENDIHYIGQTVNLKQRFSSHHKKAKFRILGDVKVYFHFVQAHKTHLLEKIERHYIQAIKPPLNRHHNARIKD